MQIASVILDQGLDRNLDYHTTEQITIGMRVLVPLRGRLVHATIIELKEQSKFKTSPIAKITSLHISKELFELAMWMSRYYQTPLRRCLKLLTPSAVRNETKPKLQLFIKRAHSPQKTSELTLELRKKSPKQALVLDALLQNTKGLLLTELLEISGITKSPIDTLLKKKIILSEQVQIDRSLLEEHDFFQTKPKKLSAEQEVALTNIASFSGYKTHLLHGITGSGKTEVYLQAIAKARSLDKSVIMLVPEIALTTQTIERFRARFSEKIAILHHRISDGERFDAFEAIRKGEIRIVIGARSAIFSPVKNLGIIIIDEEHDNSYKQTDLMPCYHARNIAIMRAYIEKATVVLGSATPSIETYTNALSGKYSLLTLKNRAQNAKRPKIHLVDMKEEYEKSDGFTLFASKLIDAMKKRLELGEQTLLFLNKRGYHSFQLCNECGEPVRCPHCSITLTFHRGDNHLTCHLCAFTLSPPPKDCPSCKSPASLAYKGFGTEQVERALHAILPDVRTLRMDADTTRHKGSHDRLFKQFRSGKADILIGTQMITKGLHFPSVTLVGVLSSDGALNIPDFRSQENVFGLITQVAGRAGRGELPGEVIIQTSMTNSPIIRLASQEDYEGFYKQEIDIRNLFDYPPKTRLTKITFSGPDETKTLMFANRCQEALVKQLPPSVTLYPVVPSGHAKVKDKYRFKLLLKANAFPKLTLPEPPKEIRYLIDVDPQSTFF